MRRWVKWTVGVIIAALLGGGLPEATGAGTAAAESEARYISVAYTVQPGDTLYGIAQRYYMSGNTEGIALYNGLSTGQVLKAGASLILPNPLFLGTAIVHQGDTLTSITARYFTRSSYMQSLMQYNGLTDAGKGLRAGMALAIPLPSGSKIHLVKAGETLYAISGTYFNARSYLDYIADYNDLAVGGNVLQIGQKLHIPNPFYVGGTTASTSASVSAASAPAKQPAQIPATFQPQTQSKPAAPIKIRIDLSDNKLYLLSGSIVQKSFPIASGKTAGLTPKGTFSIMTKVKNPWYVAKDIPGGDPRNPLGTRWLGLSVPHTNGTKYGIHGTNNPSSIGKYASLGCIRMQQKDIEWLYDAVPTGTAVVIQN